MPSPTPTKTLAASHWPTLPCCILLAVLPAPVVAGERLFDELPYDQITLDKANDNVVLKVEPLDPSKHRLPKHPKPGAKLIVRLLDQPDKTYTIQWRSIVKVEPFGQLVLNRAKELTASGRREEAYDYLKFLEANHPKLSGLGAAIEDYLYEEAKTRQREQQYDAALAMLRELYRRNPKRPGLQKALSVSTERLIDRYVAAKDYSAVRALIGNLAACFTEAPLVTQWRERLKHRAAGLLAEARSAEQSGRLREASQAVGRLKETWPALPGAKELARSIHQKYVRVVIGVGSPYHGGKKGPGLICRNGPKSASHKLNLVPFSPDRMLDWAFRRSDRLTCRTITEFVGPGSEGGEYRCPVGRMEIEKLGRRMVFQLDRGEKGTWFNLPERPEGCFAQIKPGPFFPAVTGYVLARRLLAMADPAEAAYRQQWGELLDAVAVREVYWVEADLRRGHVRPGALLVAPLCDGPYTVDSRSENEVVYVANPGYFAAASTQPKEIVERLMERGSRAIAALRQGRIEALDRVNPWDLEKLRAVDDIVVEPYAAPLLHCLIPNMRRPLVSKRAFRRALVYGIHREVILKHLTDKSQIPAGQVLSGPFLMGRSYEDPLGYGYDESIKPRPYQPRLAVALAGVALQEPDATKRPPLPLGEGACMPSLVLAHPPHEIARVACAMIKRHLELVGIPVVLKELDCCPTQLPDDVDLLYAELAIWEPVVDAARLLDFDGISGGASPYMSLALAQLQQASDWRQVRAKLRRIHRIAHDDVAVVPLWQLTDHFAYRRGLKGPAEKQVSLYQNVEQWQAAFRYALSRYTGEEP